MKNTFKYTAAAIAIMASVGFAQAETTVKSHTTTHAAPVATTHTHADTGVTTTTSSSSTSVQTKETVAIDGATRFEITSFDLDNDGVYKMEEIGEKLFYIYDTDGNEVIDNLEFDNKSVITVVPVETETYTVVDWNNDGVAEESSYTYSRMMAETGLTRFDDNQDGLSGEEFLGKAHLEADLNNDNQVDIKEWKSSYMANVKGINESEKFN